MIPEEHFIKDKLTKIDYNASLDFSTEAISEMTFCNDSTKASYNEAIKFCVKHPGHDFLILSDSLSALTSLTRPKINIRINNYIYEARKNYLEFIKNNNNKFSIKFEWIPAHRGIPGNEEAARLAKFATEKTTQLEYLVPFTDYRDELKKQAKVDTNTYIEEEEKKKEIMYFNNYYCSKKSPGFLVKNIPVT